MSGSAEEHLVLVFRFQIPTRSDHDRATSIRTDGVLLQHITY
jgi:hypothetical protein